MSGSDSHRGVECVEDFFESGVWLTSTTINKFGFDLGDFESVFVGQVDHFHEDCVSGFAEFAEVDGFEDFTAVAAVAIGVVDDGNA